MKKETYNKYDEEIDEQIRVMLRKLPLTQSDISEKLREKEITIIGNPSELNRFLKGEKSISKKYHTNVIEAIKEIILEFPNRRNVNLLKSYYYPVLKQSLKIKISGESPLKYFSDLLNIEECEVTSLISANPIVLFSVINDNFKKYASSKIVEYDSDDADLVALNDVKTFLLNKKKKVSLNTIKKSVLGHALSPFSDSIFLFCELGRYLRVTKTLGIEKITMLITAEDWAILNYSVTELKSQLNDVSNNLKQCLFFRKELYRRLNFDEIEIKEKWQTSSINQKNINVLEKEASEFELYSKLLQPIIEQIDFEKRDVDISSLIKKITDINHKERLELLSLSIVNDLKNLYTISVVRQYFKGTDKSTFLYALLQRYSLHDNKYNNVLKVGVESEKKFDFAFAKMDAFEGIKEKVMNSIYFSHYSFEKDLNIIPYTFPSGKFREKYSKIEDFERNAILIFDFESEDRRQKVKKIISKIDIEQLAIQVSDLFSFVNYFQFDDNNAFDNSLFELLEKYNYSEIKESWQNYKTDGNALKQFRTNMFSIWFDSADLPYYFYPYIIALKCIEDNHGAIESSFRDFSYELILLTTENVCKSIKKDDWR